jgi:hypothetical protein
MATSTEFSQLGVLLQLKVVLLLILIAKGIAFGVDLDGIYEISYLALQSSVSILMLCILLQTMFSFVRQGSFFNLTLSAVAVAVALHATTQLVMQPAWGWDALTFWLRDASRLAESGASNISLLANNAQPNTLIVHWAVMSAGEQWVGPPILALEQVLLVAAILKLIVQKAELSSSLRLVSVLIAITPLLENHSMVIGYAEIWMAACIALSIHPLCELADVRKKLPISVIIPLLVQIGALALMKDSGAFYGAILAVTAILLCFPWRIRLIVIVAGLVASVTIALFITVSIGESIDSYFVSLERIGGHGIWLGWQYALDSDVLTRVLPLAHALLINSSFLSSFLIFVFACSVSLWKRDCSVLFLSASTFIFVFSVATVMLYFKVDYFFEHGSVANDTSFSRLFVPIIPLFIAVVAQCLSLNKLQLKQPNN